MLPGWREGRSRLAGGRIARIAPPGTLTGAEALRCDGLLALPGLVDGHIHLDKTWLGLPWRPHRPGTTVAGRIEAEKAERRAIAEPMGLRARRLVEQVVARGTTALRTHVDVDTEVGLAGLDALLALRAEVAQLCDIQIVAFPQSGVVSHIGAAGLLEEAIRAGADLVGGLDPAGIDEDIEGQLGIVFGIAERQGVGLDIHLHDPGELGAYELRRIAARTRAAGMQGRVAVSHAYALAMVEEGTLARIAAASLLVFANTMEFCALHAVTGAHWVRLILPLLGPADRDRAIRHFWQAIAAMYHKMECPAPLSPEEAARQRALPVPDWDAIAAAACRSDEEHDISLVWSSREEFRHRGDPLYQVVAARRVGLIPA